MILGRQSAFLIDTGASVNVIDMTLYRELMGNKTLALNACDVELLAADGKTHLQVHGQTVLDLEMGGHAYSLPMVVAEIGTMDGILGMEFIWDWAFVIDPSNGLLKSEQHSRVIPLITNFQAKEQCYRVTVHKTTVIAPDKEQVVVGRIERRNGFQPPRVGEVEPAASFTENTGLLLSHALVDSHETDIVLTCANFTDESVKLKQGTTLGLLKPVKNVAAITTSSDVLYGDMEVDDLPEHLQDMARRASLGLTEAQRKQMCGLVYKNKDVFVGPDGKLGLTKVVKHSITLNDNVPIKCRPYRAPLTQRKIIEEELDRMLDAGLIESSDSPYASPVVLVTKKDGSPRFCVDYRGLNAKSVKNSWPIPNINDCLDCLSGGRYFSTLDLASGYHQCEIEEADRHKTAFVTHKGLFHFNVLAFGLCNAPATFENMMEKVLKGLQWERCIVYLDDVITYGCSFESALHNLQLVLDRFRAANLKLKSKKCFLFQRSVSFLGHLITPEGVQCEESKIEAVKNWPQPRDATEVRSFLGLANYYRKFVKSFAHIAAPLTALTKKGAAFAWTNECQMAFETLKAKLTEAPILAYPSHNPDDMFVLDCDASDLAVSGVLSQVQNGTERVIAYGSKMLSNSQRAYCATYRELLAIHTFVKQYRHYLLGVRFKLRTDHYSLQWLMNFKSAEGLVGRWIMALQPYDMSIEHRSGAKHGNADGLSRRVAKHKRRCGRERCLECTKGDGTPINLVSVVTTRQKPALETQAAEHADSVSGDARLPDGAATTDNAQVDKPTESNWVGSWSTEELIELQKADKSIQRVASWIADGRSCPTREELLTESTDVKVLCGQWKLLELRDGLLYRQWTPKCVPVVIHQLIAPPSIRQEIFRQLHCIRSGGHFGVKRTAAKVRQRYFWPRSKDDIERWCAQCEVCQKVKCGPKYRAKLGQMPARSKLQRVALDIMGELPETSNGNKYILVATDYYTKWTHAMAMPDMYAQTVADKLATEFIAVLGVPVCIHSDQGRQFESRLFQEVCELLGIEKTRSSPYHPAGDGMVERCMRTYQQMLKSYVNSNRDNWDDHLPYLNMAYRATPHESTGCSPNLMMFGMENNMPIDVIAGQPPSLTHEDICPNEYVEWLRDTLSDVYQYADEQLNKNAERQKTYYDRKAKPTRYEPGQYVWRWYPPAAKGKLARGWVGPGRVVSCPTDVQVVVKMAPDAENDVRLHIDMLKPYVGSTPESWLEFEQAHPQSNDNVQEVERVVQYAEAAEVEAELSVGADIDEGDNNADSNEFESVSEDVAYGRGRRVRKPPVRYSP